MASTYLYRITGPGGVPLVLPRRKLPQRHFLNRDAANRRVAVLWEKHGLPAEVLRSLPVQFPGEDGAGPVSSDD